MGDQRSVIQSFADANGMIITCWFDGDEGRSGTNFEGRPDFMRMVKAVENRSNDFSQILVYDVDRWGRPIDPDESTYWEYHFRRFGVAVTYISDQAINDRSLAGRLTKKIKQELATEESHKQSLRVRERSKLRAAEGYRVGGFAPYGFKRLLVDQAGQAIRPLENGERKYEKTQRVRLIPGDPAEISVVREIFRLRLSGLGYKAIANELNSRSIPPPYWGKTRRHNPGTGKWASCSIYSILRNKVYRGDWEYNRQATGSWVRHEDPERRFHPAADRVICSDAHESIISPEKFDRAQAVRNFTPADPSAYRNGRSKYLLSGLVRCQACGFNFQGHIHKTKTGEWRYYEDGGFSSRGQSVCTSFHIPKDLLEGFVIREIQKRVIEGMDRERLQKLLTQRIAQYSGQAGSRSPEVDRIRKELSDVEMRLGNLKDSIEQGIPASAVKDRLVSLEQARADLSAEISRRERAKVPEIDIVQIQKQMEALILGFDRCLETAPDLKKRELIRAFVDHVTIDQKARKATCYINKLPLPVSALLCRRPESNRHGVATGGF